MDTYATHVHKYTLTYAHGPNKIVGFFVEKPFYEIQTQTSNNRVRLYQSVD